VEVKEITEEEKEKFLKEMEIIFISFPLQGEKEGKAILECSEKFYLDMVCLAPLSLEEKEGKKFLKVEGYQTEIIPIRYFEFLWKLEVDLGEGKRRSVISSGGNISTRYIPWHTPKGTAMPSLTSMRRRKIRRDKEREEKTERFKKS